MKEALKVLARQLVRILPIPVAVTVFTWGTVWVLAQVDPALTINMDKMVGGYWTVMVACVTLPLVMAVADQFGFIGSTYTPASGHQLQQQLPEFIPKQGIIQNTFLPVLHYPCYYACRLAGYQVLFLLLRHKSDW